MGRVIKRAHQAALADFKRLERLRLSRRLASSLRNPSVAAGKALECLGCGAEPPYRTTCDEDFRRPQEH